MKRIASMLAGLGLVLAAQAHADEKTEVKDTPNHKVMEKDDTDGHGHGTKTKVESKSHHKMGGGTVSTTETKQEVDRPGLGNDTKHVTKEKTEKDANGDVTKHEIEKK